MLTGQLSVFFERANCRGVEEIGFDNWNLSV